MFSASGLLQRVVKWLSECYNFGGSYCLHRQGCIVSREDGIIIFLRHVGTDISE